MKFLSEHQLQALPEEELHDYLVALEEYRDAQMRADIIAFAEGIEVPGTPPALSPAQRAKVGQTIVRRDVASPAGFTVDGKVPDDLDFGTNEAEVIAAGDSLEFYPKQLEVADHHALILAAVAGMMENQPCPDHLNPRNLRNLDGSAIVPDGVMLMLPPGSAKSSYGSVVVPAYVMGRWPGSDVIGASYAAELAKRFGRRVRYLARDETFQRVFRTQLVADNTAVDQWSLDNGSSYRAVGVMGGVTGFRADLLCIDDPIAGREEAESDVIRAKTWEAIKDDLTTRLKPGGKQLWIMTRWHEADPMGMALGEDWDGESGLWLGTDGRYWLVLCCPMIAERDDDPLGRQIGERLWPQWFTEKHVELAKAQGERSWNSLYQQRPAASDGEILLKRFWRCWPHGAPDPSEAQKANENRLLDGQEPPRVTQLFLSYDTAFEDDEMDDYSAMTAWGVFERQTTLAHRRNEQELMISLILLGAWRGKVQAAELFGLVKEHTQHFKPDHIVIEKRASGIQLIQELQRQRVHSIDHGRVKHANVVPWLPQLGLGKNGKVPRAWAASLLLERGSIWYIPGNTTLAVIREAAAFPNGRYDDWCDTITQAVLWARSMGGQLLQVPEDYATIEEEMDEEMERSAREIQRGPGLYGHASGGTRTFKRGLYGRV